MHMSVSQKEHNRMCLGRDACVSCTNNSAPNFTHSHNQFDFPTHKYWHRIIFHQIVGPNCLKNQHINIYSTMCLICTMCETRASETYPVWTVLHPYPSKIPPENAPYYAPCSVWAKRTYKCTHTCLYIKATIPNLWTAHMSI